jgi:hypothetical protein
MSAQDKAKAMKNQPENSKEQAPLNRFHLPIPQHVAQQDTPMDAREARAHKRIEFLRLPACAPNILVMWK